jgi:hypothetical protein
MHSTSASSQLSPTQLLMRSPTVARSIFSTEPPVKVDSKVDVIDLTTPDTGVSTSNLDLPAAYASIFEAFCALESVLVFQHTARHREYTSFPIVQQQVENSTRKRFTLQLLAQIVYVMPEGYDLVVIDSPPVQSHNSDHKPPPQTYAIRIQSAAQIEFSRSSDISILSAPTVCSPIQTESQDGSPRPIVGEVRVTTARRRLSMLGSFPPSLESKPVPPSPTRPKLHAQVAIVTPLRTAFRPALSLSQTFLSSRRVLFHKRLLYLSILSRKFPGQHLPDPSPFLPTEFELPSDKDIATSYQSDSRVTEVPCAPLPAFAQKPKPLDALYSGLDSAKSNEVNVSRNDFSSPVLPTNRPLFLSPMSAPTPNALVFTPSEATQTDHQARPQAPASSSLLFAGNADRLKRTASEAGLIESQYDALMSALHHY